MAKTVANLHTSLAYRLGESSAPTSTTELARRLQWFIDALNSVNTDVPWWFLRKRETWLSITSKKRYTLPTDYRKVIELRVQDKKYEEIELEDDYETNEGITSSVVNLAKFDTAYLSGWNFYVLGSEFIIDPDEDSQTASSGTSITSSSTTATVTMAANHGWSDGYYVTIAGADQTEYNGSYQITVTSSTAFTYTFAGSATTPATGTITATRENIEMWYYYKPTEPTLSTSSIIVPDEYADALVSYAEGRYWSMAHKRGKAADGFTEHESWIAKMKRENARQKFLAI